MEHRPTMTVEQRLSSTEYQESLARDAQLTDRIKAGYRPAEPCKENPQPRVIDGKLDDDATLALGELAARYDSMSSKIARKYSRRNTPGLGYDDLKQESIFGIYHAALNWSIDRRSGFLSYASAAVKSYILRYIDNNETAIRLPAVPRKMVRVYGSTVWRAYQKDEHMPRRDIIASRMEVTPERVEEIAFWEAESTQMGSTDRGYFEDDRDKHSTYGAGEARWHSAVPGATETKTAEDEAMVNVTSDFVASMLNSGLLDAREKKVLRLRFFGNAEGQILTLQEIGKEIGVTRERVRQIEKKTLDKLRSTGVAKKLHNLLDVA